MSRYCLDTSAYSNFQRGAPDVAGLLDAADWVGLPAVAIGELWIGFVQGRRRQENLATLREFLAHPSVEELIIDASVAEIFGEMTAALRTAGRPVPTNDVWIAATAARHGATVLTYDRHFTDIPRVGTLVLTPPAS